jgi:hypothetical protein
MKPREYFILGSKLFGVWCLFEGIVRLIGEIPAFISPHNVQSELGRAYFATVVVSRIIVVLFIASGIYLLRGGGRLYRFAYPREEQQGTDLEWKFMVLVKMLGIYLLVLYIPDLLASLAVFFVYQNIPRHFTELLQHQQLAYGKAASSIGGVLLGIYLLRSGRWFIRLGLEALQQKKSNDEQDMT